MNLPRWVWWVAGLVLVAWMWESNRRIAAILVLLIVLAYLAAEGGALR